MTAEEKLKRIMNPKTAHDYGLSISLTELLSFQAGRDWLKTEFIKYVPLDKWPQKVRSLIEKER